MAPFHLMTTHSDDEDDIIFMHGTPLPTESELSPGVQVDTYVYRMLDRLEPELWRFDEFVRNHAAQWFNYVPDGKPIEVDAAV